MKKENVNEKIRFATDYSLIKATKGEDVAKEMDDSLSRFSEDVCPSTLGAQLSTFQVLLLGHNFEVECFEDI